MSSPNSPLYKKRFLLNCAFGGLDKLLSDQQLQAINQELESKFEAAIGVVAPNGGDVVLTNGLGVWSVFDEPQGALAAAGAVQRQTSRIAGTLWAGNISVTHYLTYGDIFQVQVAGKTVLQGEAMGHVREAATLTNGYGLEIVLTEQAVMAMPDLEDYWAVDRIRRADGAVSRFYEYYGHQEPGARLFKRKWDYVLQQALADYFSRRPTAAAAGFETLAREASQSMPGRSVIEVYLNRCTDFLHRHGESDIHTHLGWAGTPDGSAEP